MNMRENPATANKDGHRPDDGELLYTDSLVDQVTDMLRSQIVEGVIAPGEKIVEAALAERLGISRNPIREAVRRLEGSGLLVNHPRRGRFVRQISRDEAEDIIYFRTCIERAGIMRVAETRTHSDVRRLRGILAEMRDAADNGDVIRTLEIDAQFHRAICEMTGSSRGLKAFDDIHTELRILFRMIGNTYATLDEAVRGHEPLMAAIEAGDAETAGRVMTEHIAATRIEVEKYFQSKEQ
ncbi:DNA-binding GntR family transcriptional regulator [Paraburkholderia silvatlantica]|uniref:DNA-binding GntR family transcriptional regulator n=2 Tax=Paraburkholderia silvatlantica TaxID=321895 RepID=A0A2U0ZTP9_9BURK|nr:DNA-binding GntR family transcriptional regulator [Paraburkholderia silvatlantica]PVY22277.1 DNA-binding GntR family transcriptional regulator [Paraburkholderia silvatlantica]PXW27084.1 DNA-binding GntR family transcriptional regulator [Paraburkholderia silvatlantica]PYE21541.1 DNA-binding GntR family transcriptional regulator [Paraburkholderia silvatlantica]TDQ92236.1 DNA-binding GntR family transcriptional regulator [Paraburkholderia silvatlantica]